MYRVPGSGRTLRLIRKLRNKSVSNFNPIFITGIAGSGNTLLASLIDERLQVDGFADESALYASGRSFIKIPHVKLFRSPLQYREAMKISEGLDKKDLIREYEREYRKYLVSRGNRNVIVDKAPNAHMVRCASLLDAYPDSLFILVYRNPVSQVEGLIRKWELFKNSSIDEVCEFCSLLIGDVLDGVGRHKDKIRAIDFEDLIKNPDEAINAISKLTGVNRREGVRRRKELGNSPGFALRNVVNGEISIDKSAVQESISRASQELSNKASMMLSKPYSEIVGKIPCLLDM